MSRLRTRDVETEHAAGKHVLSGYVLTMMEKGGRVTSTFFGTYQQAIGAFAAERGALILDDEDWPRFEGWLASDPHAKLSRATCTVEWNTDGNDPGPG